MRTLFTLGIAAALLLPASLQAQDRRGDRRDRHDRGDRDERIGRISGVVADCERRTDEFERALARALDRSRLDGTRREDRLNSDARSLERSMNRLRDSWNSDRDPERSRRNVRAAISAGRDINRTLSRHALRGHIQAEWDVLRSELNRLAEAFDEPKIGWDR